MYEENLQETDGRGIRGHRHDRISVGTLFPGTGTKCIPGDFHKG